MNKLNELLNGIDELSVEQVEKLKKQNIYKYYEQNYNDDDWEGCINEINPKSSFYDLMVELLTPKGDIYKVIGVDDLFVRCRLFEYLEELLNWNENEIENVWRV